MSKPLQIGITGGIGSGKTTVCRIFETLGIPVYYADDRAKQLMVNSEKLRKKIKEIFGEEAYLEDRSLNRTHLSKIVFQDKAKLKELESVVHPAVAQDGKAWHETQNNVPYTLKEAALLVENGSYKSFDKMIMVSASKGIRIQRVMLRDGIPRAAVEARIAAQLPDTEKAKVCDYIIENNGERSLVRQVLDIHHKLISLHKTR